MNNILRTIPKMGKQLRRTGGKEPNHVTKEDVPPGQVIATFVDRDRTLRHKIGDQAGTNEECKRVEQLVDL